MPLRLGTRASALARWQAQWVATELQARGVAVELVPISTAGDRQQESLKNIGGQGLFTKEIQRALLENRIDLAVHSLKDLPTEGYFSSAASVKTGEAEHGERFGLCLAAVPPRASAADVFVSQKFKSLEALPRGATVGTGSLRRRAQLLHTRPDLQISDIRGNVDTRLRKLQEGQFEALILAEAGLRRLGFEQHITQTLPFELMLSAVGQGALGLETREEDDATRQAVAPLDDRSTHAAVLAERAMLAALQGGCLAPIAALGRVIDDRLTLLGRVIAHDGSQKLEASDSVLLSQDADDLFAAALQLGRRVAESLRAQGADQLIQASRHL